MISRKASLAMLLPTALLFAAESSIAQDKGKTAAAELTKSSQGALAELNASAPLAK